MSMFVKRFELFIDFLKNKKNRNIVICLSLLIVGSLILFNSIGDAFLDNTYKIAKKIAKELEKEYYGVEVVEGKADDIYKYSYITSSLIYVKDVVNKTSDNFTISVQKYNSSEEASKKKDFYTSLNKLVHDKFDNTAAGLSYNKYDDLLMTNIILVKSNYLFSINTKFDNTDEIVDYIDNIMKKYNKNDKKEINTTELNKYWNERLDDYSEKIDKTYDDILKNTKDEVLRYVDNLDGCTNDYCDTVLNSALAYEKYPELSDEITKVKDKYNEVMKEKEKNVNLINSEISNVKKNLDQKKYDLIKEKISALNDSYYDKYKNEWELQLSSVEETLYKRNCAKYSYKDLLRNPNNYKDKKAYFFGKIEQKIGLTQYRVGIDCSKYTYLDGYYCDNTIYVTYYGDLNLIEDDMVEMWGSMNGVQSYTSVLGAYITIPKFAAKYIILK